MLWHDLAKDMNIDAASERKVFLPLCLVIIVISDIWHIVIIPYCLFLYVIPWYYSIGCITSALPWTPFRVDSIALMLQHCPKAGLSFFGRFGLVQEKRTPDLIAAAGGLSGLRCWNLAEGIHTYDLGTQWHGQKSECCRIWVPKQLWEKTCQPWGHQKSGICISIV